jgi:hypothetical protein
VVEPVHPCLAHVIQKGMAGGWFYLRNDDGRLPPYTGHIVMERLSKWRWGAPGPK